MAISGLVLVLFVLGHMLGNLQFLLGPEAINAYAYHLHNMPGHPVTLWLIRLALLFFVGLHVLMAVLLTKENRQARPDTYDKQRFSSATYAARTMPMTGAIILAFIIFHILHFTVRVVPENYDVTIQTATVDLGHGTVIPVFDVFAMMVAGFSSPVIALFYVIATGLLCMHLTHGVASMFQSLGLRNEIWRGRLNIASIAYGWIIFLGFAIIPLSVLVGGYGKEYLQQQQSRWEAAGAALKTDGAGGIALSAKNEQISDK